MQFANEESALQEIAEMMLEGAANLYKSTKYIYALSSKDFYSRDVKDVFRVVLNNLFRADALRALGLTLDDAACAEMNGAEYSKVFSLLVYSFAVRLPTLRRMEVRGDCLTDVQIETIYARIMRKGVVNHDEVVSGSFADIKNRVRKNQPVAPYNADWYKAFLYTHLPALAEISNRNLFLYGTVDVLFIMYYMRLEEELQKLLMKRCVSTKTT